MGWLKKHSGGKAKTLDWGNLCPHWNRRFFVLLPSGELLYFKKESDAQTGRPAGSLDCRGALLTSGNGSFPRIFTLCTDSRCSAQLFHLIKHDGSRGLGSF